MDLIMADETADDLQRDGLFVIQKKEGFRFGTDAVILSDFAKDAKGKSLLDLCSGTGIIPILMSAKTNIPKLEGIEIQKSFVEMSNRSVKLNKLSDRVSFFCGDLKNISDFFKVHSFDIVTCNPPYMKIGTNVKNNSDSVSIARHEVMCNIDDVVSAAEKMLKFKGKFFMVHRPSRLNDILISFSKHKISPKRIRFVYPNINKEPTMLLIEGAYMGGDELKIMKPLIILDENGNETEEIKMIYGKEIK